MFFKLQNQPLPKVVATQEVMSLNGSHLHDHSFTKILSNFSLDQTGDSKTSQNPEMLGHFKTIA